MKTLFTLFAIVFFAANNLAQTTYNSPESIEFDYANNRWLIANRAAGNILARSSATGAITLFTALPGAPYGLEIVGNTLYACDGASVKGYDLTTAAQVFSVTTSGTFLNGLAHDNNGNLYATDFSAKKIFKIRIATQTYSTFVTGLAKQPNGIIFDQPNNRCVFVNWGSNAPIMAVDLADSTTSTLTTTALGNCDGIAKDGAGNYYVSSWNLNGVSKFNNTFTGGPTTVIQNLSNPADIFYNTLTDTLAVPNTGSLNNTEYYYMGTPDCPQNPTVTPNNLILCPNTTDTLWTEACESYQWYKDGTLIPNATNQYYVVGAFADAGSNFSVNATLNGCTEMSPEVLVDGWAFLPVTVITEGLQDTLCAGQDTLLLIIGQPYTINIQWTNNNLPIQGATNDTLVVTATGSYSVTGAPENCPDYVQSLGLNLDYTFVDCTTAITEDKQPTFVVFPNPANDLLNIQLKPTFIGSTYTITDQLGRTISAGKITAENATINLVEFPAGMYMLGLNNTQWVKFIKR